MVAPLAGGASVRIGPGAVEQAPLPPDKPFRPDPLEAPEPPAKPSPDAIRVEPLGGAAAEAIGLTPPPPPDVRTVPTGDAARMLEHEAWADVPAGDGRRHAGFGAAVAMPEDFAATSGQFLMDYDGASDPARLTYIQRMAEIGRAEGFNVVVTVPSEAVADQLRTATGDAENVIPVIVDGYAWPEDSLHFYTDGRAVVPPAHDVMSMVDPVVRGRLDRIDKEPVPDPMSAYGATPEIQFGMSGATIRPGGVVPSAAAVAALGGEARVATTFVEGGNIINGMRDGRPYAVVGADALARNKALLGTDEAGVRAAMAADLGVAPEDLHFVEQPADFHLDVAMAPWGEGQMLLNNARAAAEAQIRAQGLEPGSAEAQRLRDEAERRAVLETRTADELAAAGFEVIRVPGRFFAFDAAGRPHEIANFMNGEAGSNTDGEAYFITQRGPRAFEDAFLAALPQDVPVRLYFAMPEGAARMLLAGDGAANCTIKRLPDGWGYLR